MRAAWVGIAGLHAWLVIDRLMEGAWGTAPEIGLGALCLTGVAYATLKVWRVSTAFDRDPRRALVFGFILFFGHLLIKPAQYEAGVEPAAGMFTVSAMLVVLPAAGAMILTLAATKRRRLASAPRALAIRASVPLEHDTMLQELAWHHPALFRRPPPARG